VLDGEFLQSKVVGTANFAKETVYEYEPSTDRNSFNRVVGSVNAVNRAIERELQVFWRRVRPGQTAGQEATP
jgi:chromosome partitioning protein